MSEEQNTLYERLRGYDAIAAVANTYCRGSATILSSADFGRTAPKTASCARSGC